jgi:hypothetical protein
MLTFDLKKDSWHMWLANFGNVRIGSYMKETGTDICTYTRAVLIGTAMLAFVSLAVFGFSVWIMLGLYGIFEYFFAGVELPIESATLIGVVLSLTILVSWITTTVKIKEYIQNKRDKAYGKPPTSPGFLTLAYRKFKDKTCFKINFTQD